MRCDLLILGQSPEAWTIAEKAARDGLRVIVARDQQDASARDALVPAVRAAFDHDRPSLLERNAIRRSISPHQLSRAALAAFEKGIERRCDRWGVGTLRGRVRLTGEASVAITRAGIVSHVQARMIVLATGTVPGPRGAASELLVPEQVLEQARTLERIVILGGGRTAGAFARLYAAAGSQVSQVSSERPSPAPRPHEVLPDQVLACRRERDETVLELDSGRFLAADAVLLATGRRAATDALGLESVGLEADDRGRLWCDDEGMTWVPTIAAAGEAIGYPAALRSDLGRIQQTIAERLAEDAPGEPATISFRLEAAQPLPAPKRRRLVRTPRRSMLRVFAG